MSMFSKLITYKYNAIPMKMHIWTLIQLLEKPFGKNQSGKRVKQFLKKKERGREKER